MEEVEHELAGVITARIHSRGSCGGVDKWRWRGNGCMGVKL
jgi:hypothetical protein